MQPGTPGLAADQARRAPPLHAPPGGARRLVFVQARQSPELPPPARGQGEVHSSCSLRRPCGRAGGREGRGGGSSSTFLPPAPPRTPSGSPHMRRRPLRRGDARLVLQPDPHCPAARTRMQGAGSRGPPSARQAARSFVRSRARSCTGSRSPRASSFPWRGGERRAERRHLPKEGSRGRGAGPRGTAMSPRTPARGCRRGRQGEGASTASPPRQRPGPAGLALQGAARGGGCKGQGGGGSTCVCASTRPCVQEGRARGQGEPVTLRLGGGQEGSSSRAGTSLPRAEGGQGWGETVHVHACACM